MWVGDRVMTLSSAVQSGPLSAESASQMPPLSMGSVLEAWYPGLAVISLSHSESPPEDASSPSEGPLQFGGLACWNPPRLSK